MKRALSPSTNITGLLSAAGAIYAAAVMIWNATHHHGVINPQVILAAIAAAAFLYTRFKVTPLADPRDGNGNPLHGPEAYVAGGTLPQGMTTVQNVSASDEKIAPPGAAP